MTLSINGTAARELAVILPPSGSWQATAKLDPFDYSPGDDVLISWGSWELLGQIDGDASHVFGDGLVLQVWGGIAWRTVLEGKAYANDAGLMASAIAADVASQAGATIVVDPTADQTFDDVWTISEGEQAGAVLTRLLAAPWWTNIDGSTVAGVRLTENVDPELVTVLEFDPVTGIAHLDAQDPSPLFIGGIIAPNERMKVARRITEVRASASPHQRPGQRITVGTAAA